MTHSNDSEIKANHGNMTYLGRWMSEEYEPGLVSVIIPTYNRAKYLIEAMNSILKQTYRPIELIIVDDGSTDGTEEVVEEWMKKLHGKSDFRLRYCHQPNKGAPAARNKGLIESCGEYIQFLDSDDLLLPEKLTDAVGILRTKHVAFVVCDYATFNGNKNHWVEVNRLSEKTHTPYSHIRNVELNSIVPTYFRYALKEIGPWAEYLKIWQDFEYTFRILASRLSGYWLAKIQCLVRKGHLCLEGLSNPKELGESCWLACTKIEETAIQNGVCDSLLGDALGRRLATVSRRLALQGEWELSRNIFRQSIKRMKFENKLKHMSHRNAMYILGPKFLSKHGLM